FACGKLSTGFIAEEFPDGFHGVRPDERTAHRIAAVATAIDHLIGERKRNISGQLMSRAVTRDRRRRVVLDDLQFRLEVSRDEERIGVRFFDAEDREDRVHVLQSSWKPGEPVWFGLVDGERVAVLVRMIPNGFALAHRGTQAQAHVYTEREAKAARLM